MKTIAVAVLALGMLAGCSQPKQPAEQPQPKNAATPAPKTSELESGRIIFQKLYVAAHGWAPDARPYILESQNSKDASGASGKAAVWRGAFASPLRQSIKSFIWSGSSDEGAPARGISPSTEDTYNPANTSTQPFDISFLKNDSDQAFKVAQQHGGEKITRKAPDQPITYLLDWDRRKNQLVWHVIYGSSRPDAKLTVAVDASTGQFLRVEK